MQRVRISNLQYENVKRLAAEWEDETLKLRRAVEMKDQSSEVRLRIQMRQGKTRRHGVLYRYPAYCRRCSDNA